MRKILFNRLVIVVVMILLFANINFDTTNAQAGPEVDPPKETTEINDPNIEQAPKETKGYRIPIIPRPDGLPGLDPSQTENPEQARAYFLGTFLPRVTQFLLTMMSVASFVMLLYAGFIYFSSFGDSEKAGEAKNIIIYAVIGLVVAMLSFAIVQIISSIKL